MAAIFPQLISATKAADITDVLEQLTAEYRVDWLPVGDIDNNFGIINMSRDPAGAVIERITNAIDAVLERKWSEREQPAHLRSPRTAALEWWSIPNGRLAEVESLDTLDDDLVAKVVVTMRDGDRADLPTVDIRDYGLGIRSEEFKDTILGLNQGRKLQKLFLAGAFGQGGSTALAHSEYTVVISRQLQPGGAESPVAATIVRFNPGDIDIDKHGRYEYLIDKSTGFPFTVETQSEEFPPGTLVRHVAMQLSKYAAVMTAPTGSLWFLAHNYLFDPVIPFTIEERRTGKNQTRRSAGGNNRLLARSRNTEYKNSARRTFNSGRIDL